MFTVLYWLAIFGTQSLVEVDEVSSRKALPLLVAIVVIPCALATWWVFHKIAIERSRQDARRAATALAPSALIALLISNLLGVLVGGYSELLLGKHFILPAIGVFTMIVMIVVPGVVVLWALHPSAGIAPTIESEPNEHR